jgi:hypothetical protein
MSKRVKEEDFRAASRTFVALQIEMLSRTMSAEETSLTDACGRIFNSQQVSESVHFFVREAVYDPLRGVVTMAANTLNVAIRAGEAL